MSDALTAEWRLQPAWCLGISDPIVALEEWWREPPRRLWWSYVVLPQEARR